MNKADFIIIGGSKCGTTSLFRGLCQHPNIVGSINKELNFFSHKYDLGNEWYSSMFPPREDGSLYFEASPSYGCHTEALRRIKRDIPKVKLIYVIRNPVDKAISRYIHFRANNYKSKTGDLNEHLRRGHNKKSFYGESRIMCDIIKDFDSGIDSPYFNEGRYVDNIKNIRSIFGIEALEVVIYDELFSDTSTTLNTIFNFLEIPNESMTLPRLNTCHNWCTEFNPFSEITGKDGEYLKNYFKSYNNELMEYLGITLDWNEKFKYRI
jgi:hypothetical protein